MENWEKYYDEAGSYSKTAFGAYNNSRLGNQVVYNLVGLAIENYLTALCVKLDMMPEHSSIGGMLRQLGKQITVPKYFMVESRFINKFMNFCSLEVFEPKDPTRSDLVRMLSFTDDMRDFCEQYLRPKKTA
jgi:hypothetical protein